MDKVIEIKDLKRKKSLIIKTIEYEIVDCVLEDFEENHIGEITIPLTAKEYEKLHNGIEVYNKKIELSDFFTQLIENSND